MSARTVTITSVSQIRKGDRVVSEGAYYIPTMDSPWTVEREVPEYEPKAVGTANFNGERVGVVRLSESHDDYPGWFTPYGLASDHLVTDFQECPSLTREQVRATVLDALDPHDSLDLANSAVVDDTTDAVLALLTGGAA